MDIEFIITLGFIEHLDVLHDLIDTFAGPITTSLSETEFLELMHNLILLVFEID